MALGQLGPLLLTVFSGFAERHTMDKLTGLARLWVGKIEGDPAMSGAAGGAKRQAAVAGIVSGDYPGIDTNRPHALHPAS